ncbi:hypothetical protein ACRALDRAFT_1059826 [Sodiomyces alcalophilus JCM 7366]|uniref:uncharacterized protein n=1 Tax=Sodiomyces alcalophilus JCM 7366 TaxID=591952 RepID=UPI0039B3BFDE
MCRQHHGQTNDDIRDGSGPGDPFPWSLGVYDAHCHPTDTMVSLEDIPRMNAAVLTVMATRSQDQSLVADVAASPLAVRTQKDVSELLAGNRDRNQARVVPCFGWHPWFSHQLYDDTVPESERTYRPPADGNEKDVRSAKRAHYSAVLTPAPKPDDDAFLDSLPEPAAISSYIDATRKRLLDNPLALVGEIGLDKAFRLPQPFPDDRSTQAADDGKTPGGRDGRLLSSQRVRMDHQVAVLKAQLRLAGELGRAVSVHGVQAHGVLYDALASCWKGHEREVLSRKEKRQIAPGAEDFSSSSSSASEDEGEDAMHASGRTAKRGEDKSGMRRQGGPYPPRICLHSFSGPAEMLKQYLNPAIPARIFVSFSTAINLGTAGGLQKFEDVLRTCPDDGVLVESDLHVAGDEMDAALESMYRKVCEVKGWGLEEGVRKIGENYHAFIFG